VPAWPDEQVDLAAMVRSLHRYNPAFSM